MLPYGVTMRARTGPAVAQMGGSGSQVTAPVELAPAAGAERALDRVLSLRRWLEATRAVRRRAQLRKGRLTPSVFTDPTVAGAELTQSTEATTDTALVVVVLVASGDAAQGRAGTDERECGGGEGGVGAGERQRGFGVVTSLDRSR